MRHLLLWLWLPLLAAGWVYVTGPSTPTPLHGHRMGWLLLLPLLGLSLGILCSAITAIRRHRRDQILPGYQALTAMIQLRKRVTRTSILLPMLGACGVTLLLGEALQSHAMLPALGLPEGLQPGPLPLPPHGLALPLWSSGLLLPYLAAPALWPDTRQWWGSSALLVVLALVLMPSWRAVVFHPSTQRGWLMGLTVGALMWLALRLALHILLPKRPGLWSWRASLLGVVALYHLGLIAAGIWPDATLRRVVAWTLLIPYAAALLWQGWHTIQAILQYAKEPPETPLSGGLAYLFGATWPWAVLLGWLGWLYFGGAAFGAPLQRHPLAMLLLLGAHTVTYAAFASLDVIHSAKLHPPSRAWLFARPLLLYLTLALTLGLPAVAIFSGI